MRPVIFAFVLCLLAGKAGAAEVSQPFNHISGRDLMNFCSGRFDVDYGYCAGYMSALSEILIDHKLYGMQPCNHGPVRSQQLMELTREYFRQNPDDMNGPASVAAVKAITRSFPCF